MSPRELSDTTPVPLKWLIALGIAAFAAGGGCACSQGAGCERLVRSLDGAESWQAAPRGAVMQAGEHRGCTAISSCFDVSELPLGANLAPECREPAPELPAEVLP